MKLIRIYEPDIVSNRKGLRQITKKSPVTNLTSPSSIKSNSNLTEIGNARLRKS